MRAIKDKDVISLTTTDCNIASDFIGCTLSSEDWDHIRAIEKWLYVPAEVSTFMSGSQYPILPLLSHAFKCLLNHCINYVDHSISNSSTLIEKVLNGGSKRCLQYLNKYEG